jgi:hypothetical protein
MKLLAFLPFGRTRFRLDQRNDLDPALGDKIAASILGNMTKLKVPEDLWKPLVTAVGKRASASDVRAAAGKMDDDMTKYLLKN